MKVTILDEHGLKWALLGLSLSRNKPPDIMLKVANKLADMDGGHNKLLESVCVWLDITAPRYWWQQFDTYRVGVTKQSESTMYTITKKPLTHNDFEGFEHWATRLLFGIPLLVLNFLVKRKKWKLVKKLLPESFLQRRQVCTNYKSLRNMVQQRHDHRLPEWHVFCDAMKDLAQAEWLGL